ncbi:MAG: 4-hydroxy-tetrahydrodipicolinate synthase [Myxococcota bacterium]
MLLTKGTYTALVTPFRDDAVDEKALRELVDRQIESGVEGLVPCGTTGESVTLRGNEHATVVRTVVEQAKGRVPVVAGAGTVSTHHSIELAKIAEEARADGLLLVCPYYNKPTQAGLEANFRAIAAAVSLPIMLYNIPGRTGIDLAVDTLERLADVKSIVAIKEATGNVARSQEILARFGDRFDVFAGDDSLSVPVAAVGGSGVVSVAANFIPKEVSSVYRAFAAGDLAAARREHLRLLPVYSAMFVEANPGPVKYCMHRGGRLAPELRLPLVWPSEASQQFLHGVLDRAGLAGEVR